MNTEKDKEQGMSIEEIEDMSNFAGELFDQLNLKGISIRDAFILGFLRGREFTLEQLGIFEDDDDDNETEPPAIIKQYIDYDNRKK